MSPLVFATDPYTTWTQSTQAEFQTAGYALNNAIVNTDDGNGSITIPVTATLAASYTAMQSMPGLGTYSGGGGKATVSTSTHIYGFMGGGNTVFQRYEIATGNWEGLSPTPWAQNYGAGMVWTGGDYIWAVQGGGGTGFARYEISTNTWSSGYVQCPFVVYVAGTSLAYGGGDYIYLVQGGLTSTEYSTNNFARYSISAGTWA